MNKIAVEPYIDKINLPENLKIGLMVKNQRLLCKSVGCDFDYHGLAFGQSPFHLPIPLQNALCQNADKGHYSDPEGILELRTAISGFNKRHFNLDIDPSRVIVGPGTKDLIHTIFNIIKGGVIIPSPSWIGYNPQINLLDKHFHTFYLEKKFNYKIQPDTLRQFVKHLSGDQHILILNNPHNPTGALYTKSELEQIAQVCRENNILVIADEIYALCTYDMSEFTSMGTIFPEGTFVTNGLSKDRSAGGYRLGSCILPKNCSEKLRDDFKKVMATVYTNVSTPTQYASITAYEPNEEIEDYFNVTRQIHKIMGIYLSEEFNNIDGIHATVPKGGFYFFVDFNDFKDDLKRQNVSNSNELGSSLISCPYHIATVTGDACLLKPEDYGARIAFVDYNGKKTFDDYKKNTPKTKSDQIEFIQKNAPMMAMSVDALKGWINYIKSD